MTEPGRSVVVFDVGGVLIDWDPRHLYRKLFSGDELAPRPLWVKMSRAVKRPARQVLPGKRPCRVAAGPSGSGQRPDSRAAKTLFANYVGADAPLPVHRQPG